MIEINKRFKELMSFAAIEATTALSEFLQQPLSLEVVDVTLIKKVTTKEIAKLYPKDGGVIMTTTFVGMTEGLGAFILPSESAVELCNVLLHDNKKSTKLDDLQESALLETGNIVISCFLNALGYVSTLNNILHKKLKLTISPNGELPNIHYKSDHDDCMVRTSFHMKHLDEAGNLSPDIDGLCVFFFTTSNVLEKS